MNIFALSEACLRVSLNSSGSPQTYDPPVSVYWLPGLYACSTMPCLLFCSFLISSFDVCVHTHTHICMCNSCTLVYRCESHLCGDVDVVRCLPMLLSAMFFETESLNWTSWFQLDCLASDSQEYSWFFLPSAGILGAWHSSQLFCGYSLRPHAYMPGASLTEHLLSTGFCLDVGCLGQRAWTVKFLIAITQPSKNVRLNSQDPRPTILPV